MFRWAFVAFAAVTAISCGSQERSRALYPVDSLISAQVSTLSKSNAWLQKIAVMQDKSDTTSFAPQDSLGWSKELDIFRELEVMNKPVSQSNYLIDDNLFDPGSNLTVKAFTSTTELPVRSMRVFYDGSIQRVRKIEAEYEDENALYQSKRSLVMRFNQINNVSVLTSYTILGGQKMILADSVAFRLDAKIQVR